MSPHPRTQWALPTLLAATTCLLGCPNPNIKHVESIDDRYTYVDQVKAESQAPPAGEVTLRVVLKSTPWNGASYERLSAQNVALMLTSAGVGNGTSSIPAARVLRQAFAFENQKVTQERTIQKNTECTGTDAWIGACTIEVHTTHIQRSGEVYHQQASASMPLAELQKLAKEEGLSLWFTTGGFENPSRARFLSFSTGGGHRTHYLFPSRAGVVDLGSLEVFDTELRARRLQEAEFQDRFLGNPLTRWDTDGDGQMDSEDLDDDNDGTPDERDQARFLYDRTENSDQDQDGIGDATDTDTDGDQNPDSTDVDDDNDGKPDWFDEDDDNDGTPDAKDFADAAGDRDNDGIGDAKDPTNDPTGVLAVEPPAELRQDFKPDAPGPTASPSVGPSGTPMTPTPSASDNPFGVEGTDRKDPDYQIVESNGNFVATTTPSPSATPSDDGDSYRLLARLSGWWQGR